MPQSLGGVDIGILLLYAGVLIVMGVYYKRKCRTSAQFMVADRTIPAWAAGLAVMSAYTSSISYIATPGMSYDSNWHPMIFALCIFPVAWLVCRYAVPYYRKRRLISVYSFLEERLGAWGRVYAAFSFLLYMMGRVAVILFLVSRLLSAFVPWNIAILIIVIGAVTIIYTLLGGMEAVIWTDVMQSVIMIAGIVFCAAALSYYVLRGPQPLIAAAVENNKFSLGSLRWSLNNAEGLLSSRTIWVMIIFGVTENLRNLLADQNYVQKYCSVPTEREAKKSIWVAMLIYIPLTAVFLYIGTTLFALYSRGDEIANVRAMFKISDNFKVTGDYMFPYFIATKVPPVLKGLIVAAIIAAAMSTVDSALNCSATVLLLDFYKRYLRPDASERDSMMFLRGATILWGVVGTGFGILMIRAGSALNVWWQISGIFGGGILGLFLLSLLRVHLRLWQGMVSIGVSIAVISWGTFARELPESWRWAQCSLDRIIIGAAGTGALMIVAYIFGLTNRRAQAVRT